MSEEAIEAARRSLDKAFSAAGRVDKEPDSEGVKDTREDKDEKDDEERDDSKENANQG